MLQAILLGALVEGRGPRRAGVHPVQRNGGPPNPTELLPELLRLRERLWLHHVARAQACPRLASGEERPLVRLGRRPRLPHLQHRRDRRAVRRREVLLFQLPLRLLQETGKHDNRVVRTVVLALTVRHGREAASAAAASDAAARAADPAAAHAAGCPSCRAYRAHAVASAHLPAATACDRLAVGLARLVGVHQAQHAELSLSHEHHVVDRVALLEQNFGAE
mmetsp:Transcript_109081/g.314196  ORF Transcript_109081/g.314196 Transcript_109081/m.314196 type:complete len:221 (-) Transcript_109081:726-1388(-)